MVRLNILQVAAQKWVNSNHQKASQLGVADLDYYADFVNVAELLSHAVISREELRKLGIEALRRGCNVTRERPISSIVLPPPVRLVKLYQPLNEKWDQIDGTWSRNRWATQAGPTTDGDSCALDSALVVGSLINAFLTQHDQLSPTDLKQLPTSTQRCREIYVGEDIFQLEFEHQRRIAIRNEYRNWLIENHPNWFKPNQMMVIHDAIQFSFEGLPQASFHVVKARICCDKVLTTHENKKVRQTTVLAPLMPSNKSLSECVNDTFIQARSPMSDNVWCTTGASCVMDGLQVTAVLDRLPGLLMMYLSEGVTARENETKKLFDPVLSIRAYHRTAEQPVVTKYKPVGCVIKTGEHFIVRWLMDDEESDAHLLLFNGFAPDLRRLLRKDRPSVSYLNELNWFKGLSEDARVVYMFFKCIDPLIPYKMKVEMDLSMTEGGSTLR